MKASVALLALVAYCTAGIYFKGQCDGCRNGYAGKCKDSNPDVDDEVECRGTSGLHDIEVYCTNGNGGVTTVAGMDGNTQGWGSDWYVDEDKQCDAMKAMDCSSGGGDDTASDTGSDAGSDTGSDTGTDYEAQDDDDTGSDSSSSGGGTTSVSSGEPKKTPTVYFNALFTNWNGLTTKSKTCKESLRDQAETVLLSTAERNKLKSALTKGSPKKSLQFSTAISAAKFKEAAGMDSKGSYCECCSGLETAISYIYDAFVQGKADIENAGYELDTSATAAYDSILETLTAAKTYVASADLGQQTMTEQNPKKCDTGETPQTATAYFTKLFTQATQLYNQAKKNSVLGKSDADSIFGSASDRTKAKSAATKGINALSALKGAKFCFTYTNTAKKSNNLAEALNIKKIKSDDDAATAMATLYTAFEQGVNDIKQATVDRGKHTCDIDTAIDSAVADVTSWFESMASAGATKTGQTIESSATEVDTSGSTCPCANCN